MDTKKAEPPFSLKAILKHKLVNQVFRSATANEPYMILVMDKFTASVVGSCTELSSLIEYGFVALQDIQRKREAVSLSALYFVRPERKIMQLVAKDFWEGPPELLNQKKKYVMKYKSAYVYLTTTLPKRIVQDVLLKEKNFQKSAKALTVTHFNFLASESHVFTFNSKGLMKTFISSASEKRIDTALTWCAQRLASVCITINENPNVRYRAPVGEARSEKYPALLANRLVGGGGEIPYAIGGLPNWKPRANPGTVIILDREIDPLAPLLHELTYQAAIVDHLSLQENVLTIKVDEKEKDSKEKTYLMSDADVWWKNYRHRHINELLRALNEKSDALKKENAVAKGDDPNKWDSKQMLKKVRDYPSYREFTKQYGKHTAILKKLYAEFRPLTKSVLSLEQDMVTGLDFKGEKIGSRDFFDRLLEICEAENISGLSKVRVVMSYIITQGGIAPREKEQIFKHLKPKVKCAKSDVLLLITVVPLIYSGKRQ